MRFSNTAAMYILSAVILAVIFIIDLLTPLGFVVWLGYQFSVFLSYRSLPRRYTYTVAAISTILIALGYMYSPSNINPALALVNRCVGIVILWITTILLVQRRQSEDLISEQADLLDKADDAIIVLDMDYNLTYWNRGAECLYGYKKNAVLGKNLLEVLQDDEFFSEAMESLREKSKWKGELHQVKNDGKDIFVKSSWTLVRNKNEKNKSILIINTDITEKKLIETQFFRAQRLESIGTLAAGIAHDINNVLSPIMLSMELLRDRVNDDESKKLINIAEKSAQRGAKLIKQVQLFTAGKKTKRTTIQVTPIIFEIEQIIKETFPKNIEIRTDIQSDLWTVTGDATELNQVLMNLLVNGKDAMPDGGILYISAENHFIEKPGQINVEARPGPYIIISVSDTGSGIPVKMQEKIFDPFFTTKKPGMGTGLGLSITIEIVKSYGGFINLDSEVGKGTVFKIYLPASKTNETEKEGET